MKKKIQLTDFQKNVITYIALGGIAYVVYNLLKNLDINAKKSKAVNTIYLKDEKVFGQNTDGVGYCQALKQEMNFDVMNKNILVGIPVFNLENPMTRLSSVLDSTQRTDLQISLLKNTINSFYN